MKLHLFLIYFYKQSQLTCFTSNKGYRVFDYQKQLVLLIIISLLVGNVSSLLKLVYRETDNPESGEIAGSFPLRKKSIRGTDSGRGTRLLC